MSETTPPVTGLRIGRVRGVITTKWHRVWTERFDEPIDFVDLTEDDQLAGLRDGSLDMVFARLPIGRAGLHAIPLYDEVMVAWVSKEHAISAVDEVTMADLDDEQIITRLDDTATDLVLGGAVLVVPMSVARGASRRDLTYRPIVDAEPSPIALVWRVDDENPLIQEFIGVVRGRTVNSSRSAAVAPVAHKPKKVPRPDTPPRAAAQRGSARAPRRSGGKPRGSR